MKHETLHWQTQDGLKVFANLWRPDSEPKAVICLVHGMFEHSGRYSHVAEYFTGLNIGVLALDQRGHGKTEGKLGHTPDFDHLLNDIQLGLDATAKAFPGAPIFLYGHSMGGNVITNFILRKKPTSLLGGIATSPWFTLKHSPPGFLVWLSKVMNKIWPGFTSKSDLKPEQLARDPEVGKKYMADPLVHAKISARFFNSIVDGGVWAVENARNLTVPMLVMHGTGDAITSHPSSKQFSENAPASKMTYVEWDGFYHEMHNETEYKDVLARVATFIQGRLE